MVGMRLVAILCLAAAFAQPAIEKVLLAEMGRRAIPGLSFASGEGGEPVRTVALGMADMENLTPLRAASVFRLASVSKPFTAVAALQLAEAGRLDLDAEVQRYLPAFPLKQWPIKIRHLLCHQSGVRHYRPGEIDSVEHFSNVQAPLRLFAADPLLHPPGSKYLYSTYGYNLLGAVVEAAAGRPFVEYVRERILQPAGITSMTPDNTFAIVPNRVRGYRKAKDGGLENCALADTSNKIPGGGWVANAEDLVRFGRALLAGNLLSSESVSKMWTAQRLADGSTTTYGLGWNVSSFRGSLMLTHTGGQQGASTILVIVPERRIVFAILTNLEDAGIAALAGEVLKAWP